MTLTDADPTAFAPASVAPSATGAVPSAPAPASTPPFPSRALPVTPWRVRALDLLTSVAGRSIVQMDLAEIRQVRAAVVPRRWPLTRITGQVHPQVSMHSDSLGSRSGRPVPVRVYRRSAGPGPVGAGRPVVVFIHGGGFVLGNVRNYDPLCSFLAGELDAVVVSIVYRLAPEHPAPAAIHDCVDVVRRLAVEAGRLGVDPGRMAVLGDSAGGNLAAVLTQQLRDHGGPRLRCQVLLYPVVDSTSLRRSKIVHAEGPILTRRETDTYFRYYLGRGPGALRPADPLISPLLGRLDDLPPLLVQTAGLDPLRDEGIEYARRLRQAGVPAEATDYRLAPHGFASFPGASRGAWRHRAELAAFLRRHLFSDELPRRRCGSS